MGALLAASRGIDRITAAIGRVIAWLILLAVIVSAANAIVRKAFDISSNAWLELQWYLFGAVFMLVAAWALQRNEHVRIDVVTQRLSPMTRAWIDLVCHILFLMPFAILMTWLSWPFFWRSYFSGEASMNAGGLILWPAKGLILLGFALFVVQGVSEIIKRLAEVTGHIPLRDAHPPHDLPPTAAEEARLAEDAHRVGIR
ncbi:TRAP transporter small permease subunit [Acuticoccus sediminis]|uniref:TRAP transporter small permease subunit n=1 Tax=Acuticoccus sediminis TaxID=2184697 RepID=UPI001CFE77C7|nr:TRAP transporter small permease subunit [Acuticoccus sediminis]